MVVGELVAERYELEELVGTGGMSDVYRAHDRLLERKVALKVLRSESGADPEYVERFRQEARAVAQLSHPHIVTVIDRGEDAGHQFIVFEYVDGENLKQLVGRSGRLPVRRALEIAVAVADGLAFAHANGLVHRDVKPQNVLLNDEGEVKVTDFGIARSLVVDDSVTQTGAVMGTSTYLAPEQARGRPVSAATDVYSLGIVLWELLTGDVPFPGDNFVAVALRHVNEQPPGLLELRPDASPRLADAVARALAKTPADRFPSMDAFATELRACLAELEWPQGETTLVGAPAVAVLPALQVRRRRHTRPDRRPFLLALIVLAAAGALTAGVLALRDSGSPTAADGATVGGGSSTGSGASVSLAGIGNYDPAPRKDTHADTAAAATDGDPSTSWYTQIYKTAQFGGLKKGLGLVLDAGSSTPLTELTVTTPTPGFTAMIEAGDSPRGPFAPDSAAQTVSKTTTFDLQGAAARYYVVWITRLPKQGKAEISEAAAKS